MWNRMMLFCALKLRERRREGDREKETTTLGSKAQKLSKYSHFGGINAVLLGKIRLYSKQIQNKQIFC